MQKKKMLQEFLGHRFLVFALFMLIFSGGLKAAEEEYQKKKISVQIVNETIEQALNKIGNIADIRFFYNHASFDFSKKININITDKELRDAIGQVLAGYAVDVEYQPNRTVVLRPRKELPAHDVQKISGVVKDAKTGEPLLGASIVLKEQRGVGAVTNMDGRFHLEIMEGSATALVISFVGYQEEEVNIAGKGDMADVVVKLTAMSIEMEDVVVTGMAPRKVSGFTGRYVTVKGDQLKKLNPNNLLQALQLFDPSFRIVENNTAGSDPNALPEFRLRGDVQLGQGATGSSADFQMLMGDYSNRPNMPLFILDGFETTLQRIIDLDPERVESITILKDAASTAIYGSKAANGVVVVETKTPAQGKLRVTYSGNFNFQLPDLSSYNLMNAQEKVAFEEYAGRYKVSAWGGTFAGGEQLQQLHNDHLRSVARGVDTYWLSEPLQMGFNHRHNLYAEGGDEHMRYGFGFSYYGVTGVMKDSKNNLFSGNLDLLYRKGKLQFSNKLTVNLSNSGDPVVNFSTYAAANPYYEKRVDGQVEKWLEYVEDYIEAPNPLWNASLNSRSLKRSLGITDNFAVEYNPFQSLKLRGRIGITRTTSETDDFISPEDTRFEDTEELKKGS